MMMALDRCEGCRAYRFPDDTPRIIYGFNGFINYKGLEFSFAFHLGSGDNGDSLLIRQQFLLFMGIMLCCTAIYKDHWSVDNQAERPLWPRLSLTKKYHGSQSTGRLYNR